MAEAAPALRAIVKEGWLQKRGEHIRNWRDRYFILFDNGDLVGFKAQPERHNYRDPLKKFRVRDCQIMAVDRPRPYTFTIRGLQWTTVGERNFCVDNEQETHTTIEYREEWMAVIRNVAEQLCAARDAGAAGAGACPPEADDTDIAQSGTSFCDSSRIGLRYVFTMAGRLFCVVECLNGGELSSSEDRTRSITMASLDKSRSKSTVLRRLYRSITKASLDKSRSKSTVLTIKKRAMAHSTPARGRYDMTMNVSELGRVSPIVFVDVNRPRQQAKASPKGKPKASPKGKPKSAASTLTKELTIIQIRNPASPKTRGRKEVVRLFLSPKPVRGRGRRGQTQEIITSPKSPKNAPTPKAKKAPRAKTVSENLDVKAARTRRTRNNTEKQTNVKESTKTTLVVKSPAKKSLIKKTSAKSPVKRAKRSSVVVITLKSPVQAKPTRATRHKTQTETNSKKRRSSLVITKKPPVMTPKPAKANDSLQQNPKKVVSTRRQKAPVKRGRKIAEKANITSTALPVTKTPAAKGGNKTAQESNGSIDSQPTRARKRRTEDKPEPTQAVARKTKNMDDQSTVPDKLKKINAGAKRPASPAMETRGRQAKRIAREEAKPARGNTPTRARKRRTEDKPEPTQAVARNTKNDDQSTVPAKLKTINEGGKRAASPAMETRGRQAKRIAREEAKPARGNTPTRARKRRTEDKPEPTQAVARNTKNDDQSTVPAKLKTINEGGKRAASPAMETRGRQAKRIAREEAKPARGNTRAAASSATSPAGRAASGARRRR